MTPVSFVNSDKSNKLNINSILFLLMFFLKHNNNPDKPKRKNSGLPVEEMNETDSTCIG